MKRYLLLILIAGFMLPVRHAYAQADDALVDLRSAQVSVATLFLENPSIPEQSEAVQTCNTPRGCVALGTTLTVAGLGVSGLGVLFLTRLDTDEDDLVTVPTAFLGGTLLVTGLISTGIGIHLIRRGRRLKRMNLSVGWQTAPAAHLRVRF